MKYSFFSLRKQTSILVLLSFLTSLLNPFSNQLFAGIPDVAISYSANPAGAGTLAITATYTEPLTASGVTISIDQPGTEDIIDQPMVDQGGGLSFLYNYLVQVADGVNHIDGVATVSLSGEMSLSTSEAANEPSGNTFTINTATVSSEVTIKPATIAPDASARIHSNATQEIGRFAIETAQNDARLQAMSIVNSGTLASLEIIANSPSSIRLVNADTDVQITATALISGNTISFSEMNDVIGSGTTRNYKVMIDVAGVESFYDQTIMLKDLTSTIVRDFDSASLVPTILDTEMRIYTIGMAPPIVTVSGEFSLEQNTRLAKVTISNQDSNTGLYLTGMSVQFGYRYQGVGSASTFTANLCLRDEGSNNACGASGTTNGITVTQDGAIVEFSREEIAKLTTAGGFIDKNGQSTTFEVYLEGAPVWIADEIVTILIRGIDYTVGEIDVNESYVGVPDAGAVITKAIALPPDTTRPTVTINVKSGQADPTPFSPILYTAVFSEPIDITTFSKATISASGSTASGVKVQSITEVSPFDGTTFEIAVSTKGTGSVILSIPDGGSPIAYLFGKTGMEPYDMVIDGSGNVYTSDLRSYTVTKTTPEGISTVLGTTGESPKNITIDAYGNVYTANMFEDTVSKITPDGTSTILGTTGNYPAEIVVDGSGNIYTNNQDDISMITPEGTSTLLGTGAFSFSGVTDVSGYSYKAEAFIDSVFKIAPNGTSGVFFGDTGANPLGIAIDGSGNIFTSNYDSGNVTRITPGGISSTYGNAGKNPRAIAVDKSGNVYVASESDYTITKITPHGITDISGNPNTDSTSTDNEVAIIENPDTTRPSVTINVKSGQADPTPFSPILYTAVFSEPIDISTLVKGKLSITGSTASGVKVQSIIEVSPFDGTTFEIAVSASGSGQVVLSIPEGTGAITSTGGYIYFFDIQNVIADKLGNTFAIDTATDRVYKITQTGATYLFAQTGENPNDATIDGSGNIYTLNSVGRNITKITPEGVVTTFGTTALYPNGIAVDMAGNIYTAGELGLVTKTTPSGISSTFADVGTYAIDLALDGSGNIYTANWQRNYVTKITPEGVQKVVGTTGSSPYAIALDGSGNIYTANASSHDVTKITPDGVSRIIGTTGRNPDRIMLDEVGNVYTVNPNSKNFTKITLDGQSVSFGTTNYDPSGLTMDKDGNFITVAYNNSITKVVPAGITDIANNYNLASTSTDNEVTLTAPPYHDMVPQFMPTNSPASMESFVMSGVTYLVIPGVDTGTGNVSQIIIPSATGAYTVFQTLPSLINDFANFITNFHYFTIGSESYLAAGTDGSGTIIYAYSGASSSFVRLESILSPVKATDFTSFSISGITYLGIAENTSAPYGGGYSKTFRWSGTGFSEHQSFNTDSGGDIEHFTISGEDYLAVLGYNNGNIYKWSGTGFTIPVQNNIPSNVPSAKFFTSGTGHYLAVHNHGGGGVTIYKWNGTQFVSTQFLSRLTTGGTKFVLEQFSYSGSTYLLFDHQNRAISHLYQLSGERFDRVQTFDTTGYGTNALHGQWKHFMIGDKPFFYLFALSHGKNYIYKWTPPQYISIGSPVSGTYGTSQDWNAQSTPITGYGTPGATFAISDGSGSILGTGTVSVSGEYSIFVGANSGTIQPIRVNLSGMFSGIEKILNYMNISRTGSGEIIIPDTTSPDITLLGSSDVTIEQGSSFVDSGAIWSDNIDGSGAIARYTTGTLNTGILGTYTVGYNYTDRAGNIGNTVLRSIQVVDTTPPRITLSGASPITVDANIYIVRGSVIDSTGSVTVSGGSGGSITGTVIQNIFSVVVPLSQNTVNTIVVTARDNSGNIGTGTMIIVENSTIDDFRSPVSISGGTLSGVSLVSGSGDITSTTGITLQVPVIFNSGTATATIPSGTNITNNSGSNFNATTISLYPVTITGGLSTGEVSNGAIEFGIPSVGLVFDKPVRIEIPVPGYVGSSINIKVRHGGTTEFGTGGLTNSSTGTCISGVPSSPSDRADVSGGIATIYTCAASTFATVSIAPIAPSGGGSSAISGGGGSSAAYIITQSVSGMELGLAGLQRMLGIKNIEGNTINPLTGLLTKNRIRAKDIDSSPVKSKIITLIKKGYINNVTYFQPKKKMKRIEFIKLVGLINGIHDVDVSSGFHFPDVQKGSTSEKYITFALENEWLTYDGGKIRPNEAITLSEAQEILDAVVGYSSTESNSGGNIAITREISVAMIVDQLSVE